MANQGKFNQILFNAGQRSRRTSTGLDDLIFNGFGLQNEHFITTKVNVWNMPNINLLTFTNPKSDGGGLLDRFYKERTIKIEGHILGESLEDTQNKIDSLKKALSSKQGYLDFKVGNVYRRILCTLTNSDIINRESYDIEHATYSLSFKAEKPFRSEKQWRSELFEDVSDEINEGIYNEGSEYSNPIINILVNSATNCNQVEIEIGDDKITINHSLTAGDILDINTDEKTVLLNTNSIDFSGKFPKLQAGGNVLTVKSNGIYSFDVSVLFPKNFL